MSFWGKLGKIGLKVAPYAALAIPGIGIPAAMAISGAANAASKKLEGGSWKDAALAGGIGAGTAAVGGGALKGIGPSSGVLAKLGAGAAGKATGTGVTGAIGSVLGNIGTQAISDKLSSAATAKPSLISDDPARGGIAGSPTGTAVPNSGTMPMGGYPYEQQSRNQVDQTMPNLAQSIFQGRQSVMGGRGPMLSRGRRSKPTGQQASYGR